MTIGRILLATHHCYSIVPGSIDKPFQASFEIWCFSHPPVEHMVVRVVELVAVRSATQLYAEEDVLKAFLFETELESSAIELWVEPRKRSGAHVGNNLDVVQIEQTDKRLQ